MAYRKRIFIIALLALASIKNRAQDSAFRSAVKTLFFNVTISDTSALLIDDLKKIHQLSYIEPVAAQSNLNVAMQMNSAAAWSSIHSFTFTESPVANLKITSGRIELKLGETATVKKIIGKSWNIKFDKKAAADSFFNYLKSLFTPLSTHHNFWVDPDGYQIAEYSNRNLAETEIRDIAFVMRKNWGEPGYEISLSSLREPEVE